MRRRPQPWQTCTRARTARQHLRPLRAKRARVQRSFAALTPRRLAWRPPPPRRYSNPLDFAPPTVDLKQIQKEKKERREREAAADEARAQADRELAAIQAQLEEVVDGVAAVVGGAAASFAAAAAYVGIDGSAPASDAPASSAPASQADKSKSAATQAAAPSSLFFTQASRSFDACINAVVKQTTCAPPDGAAKPAADASTRV